MSRHAWVLGVLLLGCASVGGAEDELRIPEGPEPPRMEDVLPDEVLAPVESPEPVGPACTWERLEPQRFAAVPSPPDDAACQPAPSRRRLAELRRAVRDEWMWRWPDYAKLVVEPGCDRLGELSTVVFESSSGHGGSLDMLRLDRRADGDWDATRVDYNHYYGGSRSRAAGDPWQEDATGAMTLWRGVLPGARIDRRLKRAREALHLEAHELDPPPRPPGTTSWTRSHGFSSRDFHVDVRLVDAAGQGTEHYFGGYESGGDEQGHRLALDLAGTELWAVLGDDALMATLHEVTPDDPAIRALFAGQLWHALDRDPEYGLWYVRERLLGLAAPLGTAEHVPALLDAVRTRADEEETYQRTRVLAINAIAEITGFDVRYDAGGKPRPVRDVAAEVLRACDGG